MTAVILYRIDSDKRMRRYYLMDVQPNLFGEWCLMREWGRIGNIGGQTRSLPFPTLQEAHAALDKQRWAKERRGYCQPNEQRLELVQSPIFALKQANLFKDPAMDQLAGRSA